MGRHGRTWLNARRGQVLVTIRKRTPVRRGMAHFLCRKIMARLLTARPPGPRAARPHTESGTSPTCRCCSLLSTCSRQAAAEPLRELRHGAGTLEEHDTCLRSWGDWCWESAGLG